MMLTSRTAISDSSSPTTKKHRRDGCRSVLRTPSLSRRPTRARLTSTSTVQERGRRDHRLLHGRGQRHRHGGQSHRQRRQTLTRVAILAAALTPSAGYRRALHGAGLLPHLRQSWARDSAYKRGLTKACPWQTARTLALGFPGIIRLARRRIVGHSASATGGSVQVC